MDPSEPEKKSKFRIENNVFVASTEEINASELQEYIVKEYCLRAQFSIYWEVSIMKSMETRFNLAK